MLTAIKSLSLLAGIGTPAFSPPPGAFSAPHTAPAAILEICWFGGGVAAPRLRSHHPAIALATAYLANTAILHLWLTSST